MILIVGDAHDKHRSPFLWLAWLGPRHQSLFTAGGKAFSETETRKKRDKYQEVKCAFFAHAPKIKNKKKSAWTQFQVSCEPAGRHYVLLILLCFAAAAAV